MQRESARAVAADWWPQMREGWSWRRADCAVTAGVAVCRAKPCEQQTIKSRCRKVPLADDPVRRLQVDEGTDKWSAESQRSR